MSYKITKGDLEITRNVLKEVVRQLGEVLSFELLHFTQQKDCPSYNTYQSFLDTLVYLENKTHTLTN